MTVSEAWKYGISELAGQPEASLDARLLLERAACITLEEILTEPGRQITPEAEDLYRAYISRRKNREPSAYILQEQDFMGLPFFVTRDTLIPNQDTEILAGTALDYLSGLREETAGSRAGEIRILDLCTGTGCILLSILKLFPEWKKNGLVENRPAVRLSGTGTDISSKALSVAEENARRLNVRDCRFLHGDLFSAIHEGDVQERYDLIVSNPPYVKQGELDGLEQEVRDYEPHLALLGGEDGLVFYRRIAAEAPDFLNPFGLLMFEIGADQAQDVCRIFEENGFADVRIKKDLSGKDRVATAQFVPEQMP